jgi:hypothetical protein
MREITWILALVGALSACSGDGGEGKGDDDDDDTTEAFSPMSGEWTITLTLADDGCNYGAAPEPYTATLDVDGATATLTEDDVVWDCTISGTAMTCATGDTIDNTTVDLSVSLDGTIDGTFSDEHSFTFTSNANISCDGADCPLFEAELGATLPCTSTFDGEAVHGG